MNDLGVCLGVSIFMIFVIAWCWFTDGDPDVWDATRDWVVAYFQSKTEELR